MFATLSGTVQALGENNVVNLTIDAFGFEVYMPNAATISPGQKITVHTYMHWNQEQGPTLYGFLTEAEKKVFLLIIKSPGIGPKIALAILASCPVVHFLTALCKGDLDALQQIDGIGKKKAEQMVVQLKDKAEKMLTSSAFETTDQTFVYWQELNGALTALNYSKNEIAQALDYVKHQPTTAVTFDVLLRKALAYLSKRT